MLHNGLVLLGILGLSHVSPIYVNPPPLPSHKICINFPALSPFTNYIYSKKNTRGNVLHQYNPPGRWIKENIQLRGTKLVLGSLSHWAPRLSLLPDRDGFRYGIIEFGTPRCPSGLDANLWVDELIVGENGILDIYGGGDWVPEGGACLPGMFVRYIDSELIRHIRMDGRYAAIAHYHSPSGYYRIVSSSSLWAPLPEPATYGAILGTVGLSLVLWRERGLMNKQPH